MLYWKIKIYVLFSQVQVRFFSSTASLTLRKYEMGLARDLDPNNRGWQDLGSHVRSISDEKRMSYVPSCSHLHLCETVGTP